VAQDKNQRTCFVISPIGAEGSPVREHADDVFDYIIQPAMKARGIAAFRSDHLREPGRITEQMFEALTQEDMCIAVLTGHNPNVFYELAVAQAAARPVVIMLEKGQTLPFDIRDLRCVYYDLKLRPIMQGLHTQELLSQIEQIEAAGWIAKSPFGATVRLGGNGERGGPSVRLYSRAKDFGDTDKLSSLLETTTHCFDSMGVSLKVWTRCRDFRGELLRRADAGCRARFLLTDPDHPLVEAMFNPNIDEGGADDLRRDIGRSLEFFSRLAEAHDNVELRVLKRGCIHLQITRSDHTALATQYLYSDRSRHSPLLEAAAGSELYTTLQREFEALWAVNAGETAAASRETAPTVAMRR
jgi:hypothetical protein